MRLSQVTSNNKVGVILCNKESRLTPEGCVSFKLASDCKEIHQTTCSKWVKNITRKNLNNNDVKVISCRCKTTNVETGSQSQLDVKQRSILLSGGNNENDIIRERRCNDGACKENLRAVS